MVVVLEPWSTEFGRKMIEGKMCVKRGLSLFVTAGFSRWKSLLVDPLDEHRERSWTVLW